MGRRQKYPEKLFVTVCLCVERALQNVFISVMVVDGLGEDRAQLLFGDHSSLTQQQHQISCCSQHLEACSALWDVTKKSSWLALHQRVSNPTKIYKVVKSCVT